MTTLTGTFENGSVAVPGKLVLTLANGTVKDTTPKKVFLPQSIEILCPTGAIPGSTTIEETETKNTSYLLEYYPRISTSPDVFSEDQLSPFPFYAVIPNLASADIADLVPTGYVSDILSTGAVRIARVIAGDPALAASIGGITPKGEYNAATSYKRGDVVAYLGRFFLASEVVPFSGIVPTNTSYWMEIPVAPTGSVALGDSTVYGAGWNNSGLAPTQDAVYDILQSIQGAITLKANTTDAVLAGNPTAPTQAAGNNTTRIANTSFVTTALSNALANSPALGGNPTAPTPAWGDNDTSIITSAFLKDYFTPILITQRTSNQNFSNNRYTTTSINDVILYDSIVTDTNSIYNSSTGVATIPTGRAGLYILLLGYVITVTLSAAGVQRQRLNLRVNNVLTRIITDSIDENGGGSNSYTSSNVIPLYLNAGDQLAIVNNSGASANFSSSSIAGGANTYFSLIRVW